MGCCWTLQFVFRLYLLLCLCAPLVAVFWRVGVLERVVGACARTRGLRCPGSSLDASMLPHRRYTVLCTATYCFTHLLACLLARCPDISSISTSTKCTSSDRL